MEYNYKSINFLYVSDDVIRFYDKNKILRFTINRPLAYVYAQDSYIYIKYQNDNIIRLDFIDSGDAAIALDRLKPYLKNVNPEYYTSDEIDELFSINIWTFDFMTDLTIDIYAPFNIKINSVTAIVNSPTTTITVNSNPYSLGDIINLGSLITITVDINSVINLTVKS